MPLKAIEFGYRLVKVNNRLVVVRVIHQFIIGDLQSKEHKLYMASLDSNSKGDGRSDKWQMESILCSLMIYFNNIESYQKSQVFESN